MSARKFRTSILLALVALAGCTRPPAREGRTHGDDLGRLVTVTPHPLRIISLAPSITEILFALGAGDRIAGVTSFCDFPPEARSKPKVGDTLKPDIERIISLRPDLVLVSTSSQLQAFTERLEGVGIPVFVTNPKSVTDVLKSIQSIGLVIDSESRANDLVTSLGSRISSVEADVSTRKSPSVLYILQLSPLITAGHGTFIDDLITRAGGRSISSTESAAYPQFSRETVFARAPEVILIPEAHGAEIMNVDDIRETFRETPAVSSGRLIRINPDLIDRPGPRLVEGLEALSKAFHAN